MHRIKMILLAMASVAALSSVGVSAAAAGTGDISIGAPPCDITFTNSGGPTDPTPNTITINNVNEDPTDPDCAGIDIKSPTSVSVAFAGNGTLVANGLFVVSVGFPVCSYPISSMPGTNTATTANITGTLPPSFPCPSVTATVNVNSF